jgi:hypothetical protein
MNENKKAKTCEAGLDKAFDSKPHCNGLSKYKALKFARRFYSGKTDAEVKSELGYLFPNDLAGLKKCMVCGRALKNYLKTRKMCGGDENSKLTKIREYKKENDDNDFIVKKSTIPGAGKGLFLNKNHPGIKKGTILNIYTGDLMTKAEMDVKYPGNTLAPYGVDNSLGQAIDAVSRGHNKGKYMNDTKKKSTNHFDFVDSSYSRTMKYKGKDLHYVEVKAKKNVKPGEEMFIGYGDAYWYHYDKQFGNKKT